MDLPGLGEQLSNSASNMSNFWINAQGIPVKRAQLQLSNDELSNALAQKLMPIRARLAELGLGDEETASPLARFKNTSELGILSNDYENGLTGRLDKSTKEAQIANAEKATAHYNAIKDLFPGIARQEAQTRLDVLNKEAPGAADLAESNQKTALSKNEEEMQRHEVLMKALKEGGSKPTEHYDSNGNLLGITYLDPLTGKFEHMRGPTMISQYQTAKMAKEAGQYGIDDTGMTPEEKARAVGQALQTQDPKKMALATRIRSEFEKLPIIKEKVHLDSQLAKAEAALAEGQKSGNFGPSDQAIQDVFTTTVTGRAPTISQYAKIKEYQPIFNKIQGYFQKWTNTGGAGLTMADRQAIIAQARALAGALGPEYDKQLGKYKTIYKNPQRPEVLLTGEEPQATPEPTPETPKEEPSEAPQGKVQKIGRFTVTTP